MSNSNNSNNNDAATEHASDKEWAEATKQTLQDFNQLNFFDDAKTTKVVRELNAHYERHGIQGSPDKAPDVPDVPPCDACGTNWSGHLGCTACRSAWYCSRECQINHWKHAGHKQNCKQMRVECKQVAAMVISYMTDQAKAPNERVDEETWKKLDGAGAYNAALSPPAEDEDGNTDMNINQAILQMMQEDKEDAMLRHLAGRSVSFVVWIMNTFFRGNRREGFGNTRGAFSRIDPYRIRKYIFSHDTALEDWFQASMVTVAIFLDPRISSPALRASCQRTARDVAAGWSMVFQDACVSKGIVLIKKRGSSKDDPAVKKRALWMVQQVAKVLPKFWSADPSFDTGGCIEAHLFQVAAMLKLRLEEFGVQLAANKDFVKVLGVKGKKKAMFQQVSTPLAKAAIEKGRSLSNPEAQNVLKGRPWNV